MNTTEQRVWAAGNLATMFRVMVEDGATNRMHEIFHCLQVSLTDALCETSEERDAFLALVNEYEIAGY